MNGLSQSDLEHLKDMINLGKITALQANVEMVRMARVRVINSTVPAQIRKTLNDAVKTGYLSHKKKDGRKPEVYYHPDFEYLANDERNQAERRTIEALIGTLSYAELP